VLGCQYRKCLDDSSGFPAPLLDVLAAYRYLTTTLGFAASDILVAGESAGGHATLALVAQLDALQLPLPGGLVMCSPWVDFTNSFQSWQRNTDDILTKPSLDRAVRSACRHYDTAALVDPFFSPSFAPPSHWKFLRGIPVFLSYGTAEAFEDEIEALVRSMRSDDIEVAIYKVSLTSIA
jgi:acetyl esterase/lipase